MLLLDLCTVSYEITLFNLNDCVDDTMGHARVMDRVRVTLLIYLASLHELHKHLIEPQLSGRLSVSVV